MRRFVTGSADIYGFFINFLSKHYGLFSTIVDMETVMKTIITDEAGTERKSEKENLYRILTMLFMGAGFLAPLLGMVFAVVHSAMGIDIVFGDISTILFVAAIPFLFVGSHFMDIERKNRRQRKYEGLQNRMKN